MAKEIPTTGAVKTYVDEDHGESTSGVHGVGDSNVASEDYVDNVVPIGVILMWSGSISDIPSKWALCDGNNGTPDLRDRFVIGAGDNYNVDDTGGSETEDTSTDGDHSHGDTFSVNNHTLATSRIPSHNHRYEWRADTTGEGYPGDDGRDPSRSTTTTSTGGSGSHSHGLSGSVSSNGDHSHSVSTMSPYYALAYIQRVA